METMMFSQNLRNLKPALRRSSSSIDEQCHLFFEHINFCERVEIEFYMYAALRFPVFSNVAYDPSQPKNFSSNCAFVLCEFGHVEQLDGRANLKIGERAFARCHCTKCRFPIKVVSSDQNQFGWFFYFEKKGVGGVGGCVD